MKIIGFLGTAALVWAIISQFGHVGSHAGATPIAGTVRICADPSFSTKTFTCADPSAITTFSDEILAISCTNNDCGPGDNVAVSISGTDAEGNLVKGNGIVRVENIQTAYNDQKGWVYLNEAFGAANVPIVPGVTYEVTVTDPNDPNGNDLGTASISS